MTMSLIFTGHDPSDVSITADLSYRSFIGWLKMLFPMVMFPVLLSAQSGDLQFHHLGVSEGLSQTSVLSITQDARGFIWMGTRSGLNRYDGHVFRVYKFDAKDSASINSNYVLSLYSDKRGITWVGTTAGLQRYRPETDNFQRIPIRMKEEDSLGSVRINCFFEDHNQVLWVGTDKGLCRLDDPRSLVFSRFTSEPNSFPSNVIQAITEDATGNIWIGTENGLTKMKHNGAGFECSSYNREQGELTSNQITALAVDGQQRLWIGTRKGGLNVLEKGVFRGYMSGGDHRTGPVHNYIRNIVTDPRGRIWIATQEGLNLFDATSGIFTVWQHDPNKPGSLSQNSIYGLFRDRANNLWLGTYFGGANLCYAYNTLFKTVQFDRSPGSISNNVISGIAEDDRQNLWIGTEGGGLNYWDRTSQKFTSYKYRPGDSESLGSNLVKDVAVDKSGSVWVALHAGGLSMLPKGRKDFKQYRPQRQQTGSIPSDDVCKVFEDSYGRLWIGTDDRGFWYFNRESQRFQDYFIDSTRRLKNTQGVARSFYEDVHHNLWIGTNRELLVLYAGTDTLFSLSNPLATPGSRTYFSTNVVTQDTKGRMWIGTAGDGLYMYIPAEKSFRQFTTKDGLPSNEVIGILQDDRGYLWISTDRGLSRMDFESQVFTNYNVHDGLAGDEFNFSSYYKDSRGNLYFGGFNGLSYFRPQGIETNDQVSPVLITTLKLGTYAVSANDSTGLTATDISMQPKLSIPYTQKIFSLEFSLLNFIKSSKNLYSYKLEGYDNDWTTGHGRTVTYSGLPPGTYRFQVKAANNDGLWTRAPIGIEITVLPPPWRTWWAYCLYLIIIGAALFFVLRFLWLRAKFRREAEMQRFKLDFFTNISHEIRTHLSLIVGPVENLLLTGDHHMKRHLTHVKSNADRLLHLVGEMMDLNKAESNHLELKPEISDAVSFLFQIFRECEAAARSKEIQFVFNAPDAAIELWFDKLQLGKVFFNLLTNAIKFTPEGGCITLEIVDMPGFLKVLVTDNGIGIPKEHLPKLFTTYYQVHKGDTHHAGYGLGLALAKSLVTLHNGSLSVDSIPADERSRGNTCFTVILPKQAMDGKVQQAPEPIVFADAPVAIDEPLQQEKDVILLVDDNRELRIFVRECLEEKYIVHERENGDQGLVAAFEIIPDLVISDIMMPGTDGLYLCDTLKKDERTSHIPVILLTARHSTDHMLEGMESGADAYIKKPFSVQLLKLQIENLLAGRAAMRKKYARQLVMHPAHAQAPVQENSFLKKMIEVIETNMEDKKFGVGMLSTHMAMSQPVLYRKLKALTDMSVNDFIKSIKLRKAADLLVQRELTVNEISFLVGYYDRKYFSREFKKQFGMTPSEYALHTTNQQAVK